jgi:large subunit ribosomal protein L19
MEQLLIQLKLLDHGKVRRAKLYYLRDRTGKSARIAEKIRKKIGIEVDVKPETVTEETLAPVSAEPEKKPAEPEKKKTRTKNRKF